MNCQNESVKYLDEALKEVKIIMEKGAMKLYVPPEYLMILMTKTVNYFEAQGEPRSYTGWEYLKKIMDDYVGENFERVSEKVRQRVIDFLSKIYAEHKTELKIMKAIKEGIKG